MASRELTLILTALRGRSTDRASQSLAQARDEFAGLVRLARPADDVRAEPCDAGGVPAEWVRVPESRPARVLVFLHGGAYLLGSPATHRDLVSRLARAAGATALSVDYRLAPEQPFPAALEDAERALSWVRERAEASELLLAGDSAGGGLALALLARCGPGSGVRGVALFSPWVDLTGSGASIDERAALDPVITRAYLEHSAQLYLQGADPRDPAASPLFGPLADLPPLLVQVGERETLFDDARRMVEAVRTAGGRAELDVWPEMIHGWQLYARLLPEGAQALEQAGRFLAGCLHPATP
jgi:epsilon-lactone hydrolase